MKYTQKLISVLLAAAMMVPSASIVHAEDEEVPEEDVIAESEGSSEEDTVIAEDEYEDEVNIVLEEEVSDEEEEGLPAEETEAVSSEEPSEEENQELPAEEAEETPEIEEDEEYIESDVYYAEEFYDEPAEIGHEGYSDGAMFYPGEPSDEEMEIVEYVEPSGRKKAAKLTASNTTYYTDVNEAGAELAWQLADRMANPVVYVDFTSDAYSSWTAAARAVVNAAWTHNGVPNQGDYLQHQYNSWTCKMYPTGSSGYKGRIVYTFTYLDSAEQEAELAQAIDQLIDELGVRQEQNEVLKFAKVYSWMTSHITYDNENLYDSTYLLKHTAYAALINRTAVCQGYATLLYRICLELGLDCRYIGSGGHAWNLVKINGLYYYADTTWDAGVHPGSYQYFLNARGKFYNHGISSYYSSDEWVSQYPSGTENIPYPEELKKPAEGIQFREGTKDVYYLEDGQIRIFADVYPADAYEGDVNYRITQMNVNDGSYSRGNSSSEGKYVAVTPEREGTFTVVAEGGGFSITKTFRVESSVHDITVSFKDTNSVGPQDLSAYTRTVSAKIGESLNFEETFGDILDELRNKHYRIFEDDIPEEISEDTVIRVGHETTSEVRVDDTEEYVRKIRFLDEGGNELRESITQTVYFDYVVDDTIDLVLNGPVLGGSSWTWRNGVSKFPAYTVEPIEGYVTDVTEIPEVEAKVGQTYILEEITFRKDLPYEDTTLDINSAVPVTVKAYAESEDPDMHFLGWTDAKGAEVKYPAYHPFEISDATQLYAVFGEDDGTYALDVNARLNGAYRGSTSGFATFDVVIDGKTFRSGAVDFYKKYPAGTEFEITNIQTMPGYTFAGVGSTPSYSGCVPAESLTGHIGIGGITDVSLVFISDDYAGTAGNIAKMNTQPVIEEPLSEGETMRYVIDNSPSANQAFGGWNMNYDGGDSTPVWNDTYYLDVNAKVDGAYKGNTKDVAKFDVFVDGELAAHNVTDYYKRWPEGASYKVKVNDVDAKYTYIGVSDKASSSAYVYGGGEEGFVQSSRTEAQLMFKKQNVVLTLEPNCEEGSTVTREVSAGTSIRIPYNSISRKNYVFAGWATTADGEVVYGDCERITVAENMTLYAVWTPARYVDVNGLVNGGYKGSLSGIAKYDVYADGKIVATQVSDFYKKFGVGTEIRVTNIQPAEDYVYTGTSERKSYGGVYHQNSLIFEVGGDSVNDVLLSFASVESYTGSNGCTKDCGVFAPLENAKVEELQEEEIVNASAAVNELLAESGAEIAEIHFSADISADQAGDIEIHGVTAPADAVLFHVSDDGVEVVDYTLVKNVLRFHATGYSPYILATQEELPEKQITGISAELRSEMSKEVYAGEKLFLSADGFNCAEDYLNVNLVFGDGTEEKTEEFQYSPMTAPETEGSFDLTVTYTDEKGNTYSAVIAMEAVIAEPVFSSYELSRASGYAGSVNGVSLKRIVFTDEPLPETGTAKTYAVGYPAKHSVMAWLMTGEEDTLYVSSCRPGVKVIHPGDGEVNVGFITELDAHMLDTSRCTEMPRWTANGAGFQNGVKIINYSGCNFENVTSLATAFNSYRALEYLDLNNCNFSNVESLSHMCYNTPKLVKIDMGGTQWTKGKVTNLEYAFGSSGLKEIDLGGLETSSVTTVQGMFVKDKNLVSVDLSNCDLSNVTNAEYMFQECRELETVSFHSAGMPNVKDSLRQMFDSCVKLQDVDLSGINFANVSDVFRFLFDCRSLRTTLNIDAAKFDNSYGYTFADMAIGDNANVVIRCTQESKDILDGKMIRVTNSGYTQHVTYEITDAENAGQLDGDTKEEETKPNVMVFAVTENASNVKVHSLSATELTAAEDAVNKMLALENKSIDEMIFGQHITVDGEGSRGIQFAGLSVDKTATRIFIIDGDSISEVTNFSVLGSNVAFRSEVFGYVLFVTTK